MQHVINLLRILLTFLLVDLPVTMLGFLVVPIALLACNEKAEHLPRWAWLWDNDETGINGDAGWCGPEHANGRERTFWWRFLWLAVRNPANNWGYRVLGWETSPSTWYSFVGDPKTSNRDPGHPGAVYIEAHEAGLMYPCYYLVKRWSKNRCLRIYLGWKNLGFNADESRVQFVFVINPFMTFVE